MASRLQTISVNQLVHGYDGGHKLLAGSRELPPVVARKILVQSDLPGTIPPKPFETYLTAYPLHEIAAYAFARTWYAPEMPRPGCVWTHTLIIESKDVATIPSLSSLLPSFQRPLLKEFGQFRSALDVELTDIAYEPDVSVTECENLVRAFYSATETPVIVAGNDPEPYERLFIGLWSQLWPQARLTLTFSTGSLSARKFDSRAYDLQLVPTNSIREVLRASGAVLASGSGLEGDAINGAGIRALVMDLTSHGVLGLREFLAEVADSEFTRYDAVIAAMLQQRFSVADKWTETDAQELLHLTAEYFPSAGQATGLKRYCFTAIERSEIPQVDRWILFQVATHDFGEAFTSPEIGLSDRMSRLLTQNTPDALDFLLRLFGHSLNQFGEHLAHAIISTQSDGQVLAFLRRHSQFVSTFVRIRPTLATRAEFWTALNFHSHEILEAVAEAKAISSDELNQVFAALFNAQLDREAHHFFSLFGVAAVSAAFAHRGSCPEVLHDRWTDALEAKPDLVETFLAHTKSFTPEILAGVSATYPSARAASAQFPIDLWLSGLAAWHPKFAPGLGATVETSAFSLAVAFQLADARGAELCRLTFQNTYAAAAADSMPYSAWSELEPLVPHISWSKDWDRCERMRRALILRFNGEQWPLEYLLRTLHQSITLREFLQTALCLSEGRKLMERMVAAIEAGSFTPEPAQLNVIQNSLEKNITRRLA